MSHLHPFPVCYENPSGLRMQLNSNGSIKRIDCGDILINLFLGTETEGGPANIYLRRHNTPVKILPLLGPQNNAAITFADHGMDSRMTWDGLHIAVALRLSNSVSAWFWHVTITNTGSSAETFDLLYVQDVGIAHYWAVRLNEYYVSHYIDHTPLNHARAGVVIASRQNLSMSGKYPWLVIGSLGTATKYATDALHVYGLARRAGTVPEGLAQGLPGVRKQHEHSMVAVQDMPVTLPPGASVGKGFFGWFEPTHPEPTTAGDLVVVDKARSLPEAAPPQEAGTFFGTSVCGSLFTTAPHLAVYDLTEAELSRHFPGDWRHEERDRGTLLSFFTGDAVHVVLREKERRVLRPHGHIIRSGSALVPDEAALTSTVWMNGVFHSMVTQGHVNINRFLSTTHTYLGLFRSNGLRLFVELDGTWQLLDMPSAYAMAPDQCRWLYRHAAGLIEVVSTAPTDRHVLLLSAQILEGAPVKFLAVLHVALGGDDGSTPVRLRLTQDENGIFVHTVPDCDVGWRFPEGGFRISPAPGTVFEGVFDDAFLFSDNKSRQQPFLCLLGKASSSFGLELRGCLVPESALSVKADPQQFWRDITAQLSVTVPTCSEANFISRLGEIMPWFVADALIHYLSPRGLEQYSGGGWGTRDVSQGPVEMMLALGRYDAVRDILLRVFGQHNPDGDWPQWFMFFERERGIRPPDSHGDIVFWPVLALAQYLTASGDIGLLDARVPFFHPEGGDKAEHATIWDHIERALALMARRVIRGTHLAAFGNGDWNDSLQPVKPEMRERLCSSWTVTLHYQTLRTLAAAVRRAGRDDTARSLDSAADRILDDFQRLLIVDGVIAGFGYFHDDGTVEYLLHPRDTATGISYSLLPMMHAIINDMLSPTQARQHLSIIHDHLLGPDGARLFDRPLAYRGGSQQYFQRAESTTFFGRENGLMYMHAHLRYAEALAHSGDADGLLRALCQACPIAIRDVVPQATLRQANCYYSSSDPVFNDRYEAFAQYDRVKNGKIDFEGGWRVYSSGAGIFVRLLIQNFFGLRWERDLLLLDPVMPRSLDGMSVRLCLHGKRLRVIYHLRTGGTGPVNVMLNGRSLPFTRGANPYRQGAAEIPMAAVMQHLTSGVNDIDVFL
ncbi:MAG: hypothetical protein N3B18_04530 [Desulfobacterota bacterium]|nr:hypothetical protein [Thermodesulfobacteriota bacterium]